MNMYRNPLVQEETVGDRHH